ncbi:MAG: hypothetical protein RM021_018440 [Nostoc sp. EkiNYC01]|nr:hypothetical protein [Nostoc sp. EkiNYC01]
MGIVELFIEFAKWAKDALPKIVQKNQELRDEIRKVVNTIAQELHDGLELVELRIKGGRYIKDPERLQEYLLSSREKMIKDFSEFKICAGIRDLRDRFDRVFDPIRFAVELENVNAVKELLYELEKDERLIMDETGELWWKLDEAAQSVGTAEEREALYNLINEQVKLLHQKKANVTATARSIIDTL